MQQVIEMPNAEDLLSRPYSITRSKLGAVTKLYHDNFICSEESVCELNESISDKLSTLIPSSGEFQYIVSFSDNTHFENKTISDLSATVKHSGKKTDRLVLNWGVLHEIDGIKNELNLAVRVSGSHNPLLMLQAALSKSPSDIDEFESQTCSVSVSITGATGMLSEELFAVVGKWIEANPKPESLTNLNEFMIKHEEKFEALNNWLFPMLFIGLSYYFITQQSNAEAMIPVAFIGLAVLTYIKSIARNINRKLYLWGRKSLIFHTFDLTKGDSKEQNRLLARSRNSTIKLVTVNCLSIILNTAAGVILTIVLDLLNF